MLMADAVLIFASLMLPDALMLLACWFACFRWLLILWPDASVYFEVTRPAVACAHV